MYELYLRTWTTAKQRFEHRVGFGRVLITLIAVLLITSDGFCCLMTGVLRGHTPDSGGIFLFPLRSTPELGLVWVPVAGVREFRGGI